MTRDEVVKILYVITNTYPSFKPDDMSRTADAWEFFLADYEYNVIAVALKTYVQTSAAGFPPSVSQLIEMTHKPKELSQMNPMEAWSLVRNAIGRSAYYSQEEYEKLPPECQKAVGSASQLYAWALDEDFNESVVSSNFQRTYRTVLERDNQIERLPIEARLQMDNLARIEGSCADV